LKALRIRILDSMTTESGHPTIVMAGMPPEMPTSTVTGRAFTPLI